MNDDPGVAFSVILKILEMIGPPVVAGASMERNWRGMRCFI
jgi:hypothetical protein